MLHGFMHSPKRREHICSSLSSGSMNWIQWFVKEQVEEESSAQQIIDKLELAGQHGVYFLDRDIMKLRG